MDILIKNVDVFTSNDANLTMKSAYIGIKDGKIAYLSEKCPDFEADEVIDGTGKVIMPGIVNAHTHVSMALLRGAADDFTLQDWLFNHVFPIEAKLDDRCIYLGAMLGIAEMIRSGTVSITDMYMFIPNVAQAVFDSGIYANISNGATCFDSTAYDFKTDKTTLQMESMLEHWHKKDDDRILLDASIHAEYTSFDTVWKSVSDYAKEQKLNMHIHLSETEKEHADCLAKYGKTPTEVLNEQGVFDTPVTAAHCVYLSDNDMDILAAKGATVAHNPISNLKLAGGIAPVTKMLQKGINVALGTDSVCSNNNHDMFEEIKAAALLQKGITRDGTVIPAATALKMGTINGARAQGRGHYLGKIAVGYDASLIMLDFDAPHLFPVHDITSSLAYSARGSDVCLTMVRGKVLWRDGKHTTIDLPSLYSEINSYVMPKVFGR